MRRIGVLMGSAEDDPDSTSATLGFGRVLKSSAGWTVATSASTIALRPAGDRAEMLATELVALRPDVILGNASPATGALQRETSVIPIVFAGVADPVGSGFVEVWRGRAAISRAF